MFKKLAYLLNCVNRPIAILGGKIGGILLLFMTIIVVLQIAFRYIFNTPLDWTDEASRFAMIYMTYLCLPLVYLANKNIAMTLLTDMIKGTRFHVFLSVLTHIIALITFSVWIYFGINHFNRGAVMADSIPIQMYWIYAVPPILFAMTCLCALERLFTSLDLLFSSNEEIKKASQDENTGLPEDLV